MFIRSIIIGFALLASVTYPTEAGGATANGANGEPFRLTGTLRVIWGDPVGASTILPHSVLQLTDDAGRTWRLVADEETLQSAGGLSALRNKVVVVEGQTLVKRHSTLLVERISRVETEVGATAAAANIAGSQPYVWLFFRFADNPNPTAEPFEWFEAQALGENSLDPFWREVSYHTVNLAGSTVFRHWFDLPGVPADYGIIGDTDNGDVDTGQLLTDAIAAANPLVDFRAYEGMILIFNGPLDCCAWGGRPNLSLDSPVARPFGVVWAGVGGYQGHDVMTHEMGHSFGLPHASGCGVEYESIWDLMGLSCGTCTLLDPRTNTPHGVHAGAYHKDLLGWIHPLHQYTLPSLIDTAARITLHDLVVPPPAGQLLMARVELSPLIPLFYTVERRSRTGYDMNLPDDVVVIYEVDERRSIPADLVDVDGGECNDEGSMWRPGEAFYHPARNVLIGVEWANATSSGITMTNVPRDVVYVDGGSHTCENGSSLCPWNTISEGHAAATPNGQVYVFPGVYPERIIMGKPARLARWGNGSVTIGQ